MNWCPRCMTALADAEVEYRDRKTKLNYIKFRVEGKAEGEDEYVTIATTRPELLCTCQLVAVNPEDEGKSNLVGKRLKTPIFDRVVDVVKDEKVDPDFGTGIVMICTIGDKDDLEWVYKYNLPLEKGIDEEGRMTALCGEYEGLTTEEAKAKIIEDMEKESLLVKQEELDQSIGVCWRCHTPIEFLQMKQWFLKILGSKDDILKMSEELNWYPPFMETRLIDWVNSLGWDWVISRQRYFATAIPVWECTECDEFVPASEKQCYVEPTVVAPPVTKCPSCGGELKGCEDVFDTWMDSSISPLFNAFWLRDDDKFNKLFPMSLRPQAHDIIRTWTYYTMLRSKLLTDKKPWENIMIHGYILAPDGKPMHTSLGNIIDPIPVLEKYGSDAFRYYTATCAPGKDSSFMEKEIVHGFKFCTKFWNVEKFIRNSVSSKIERIPELQIADRWILSKYSKVVEEATRYMDDYEFNFALKAVEQFVWHQFADHYLEMVKHRIEDDAAKYTLYTVGYGIARLLAPLIPHITEEVYQSHYKEFEGEKSIHIAPWPSETLKDEVAESKGEAVKEVIATIRNWKASKGLKLSAELTLVKVVGKIERLLGSEADITGTTKAKELKLVEEEEISEEVRGIKPNYERVGTEYKKKAREVIEALRSISKDELNRFASELEKGEIKLELKDGEVVNLTRDMVKLDMVHTHKDKDLDIVRAGEFIILLKV